MSETTTATAHESHPRRASTDRRRRRCTVVTAAAATAALAALTLSGCGASQSDSAADLGRPVPSTAIEATDTTRTASFGSTGHPETFTVPTGITSIAVDVAGGAGGGDSNSNPKKDPEGQAGAGYEVSGTLAVTPGEQLTIAVGGGGGLHDGNKSPGAGGWGLGAPGGSFAGGTGGGGHSGGADGSGGGGASIIARDSHLLVVAGGGGGMGGVATISQALLDGQKGGDAGNAQGENGDASAGQTGGRGAGSVDKYLDPHGGSATSGVAGGGGGGGGGYTTGEGGTKGVLGGGGGGGGNSYTTELSGRSHSLNTTRSANGYVKISWFYDERGTYTFQTTAVSSALMLEDNGGSTEAGHWVDIWQPIHDSNGLQTNYKWSYEYDADKNAGQLRNQDSGLCLEVNGTNGRIDQWPCDADSDNHLWKIVPVDGAGDVALKIVLDKETGIWPPGTYYLALPDYVTATNGTEVQLSQDITDSTVRWQLQKLG